MLQPQHKKGFYPCRHQSTKQSPDRRDLQVVFTLISACVVFNPGILRGGYSERPDFGSWLLGNCMLAATTIGLILIAWADVS
ncbi:unnamed protein product [Protopolystoma xenopodis]|uniref:Uncharacterized protein n=1 Tax=Protopolystoma xenopodis TaxID=117903 RepID=A0A3S5FCM6_9PLAT|nr:unnamed protein product [Protopolystoma xenopodis]